MRFLIALLVLGLASTSAVALKTARMALPEEFSAHAERLPVTGFGGYNKGRYELGVYAGEFRRDESRLGIFDPLYASNKGKSSFSLAGPGFDEAVSADCEMRKRTVTVGIVTFDPKKMAYQCDFRSGDWPLAASFVLGQKKPESMKERLLARAERVGEARVFDRLVTLRSTHAYAGSKLSSPTPVGYLLELDGQLAGAVELTDVNPTILLLPDATGDDRKALLVAAMAVAVLRDPEESMLGE